MRGGLGRAAARGAGDHGCSAAPARRLSAAARTAHAPAESRSAAAHRHRDRDLGQQPSRRYRGAPPEPAGRRSFGALGQAAGRAGQSAVARRAQRGTCCASRRRIAAADHSRGLPRGGSTRWCSIRPRSRTDRSRPRRARTSPSCVCPWGSRTPRTSSPISTTHYVRRDGGMALAFLRVWRRGRPRAARRDPASGAVAGRADGRLRQPRP